MFSCFLLDSFEFQEKVCLIKHGATSFSLNISRRTLCSGYAIRKFFVLPETEESISEVDRHRILQEASKL